MGRLRVSASRRPASAASAARLSAVSATLRHSSGLQSNGTGYVRPSWLVRGRQSALSGLKTQVT